MRKTFVSIFSGKFGAVSAFLEFDNNKDFNIMCGSNDLQNFLDYLEFIQ